MAVPTSLADWIGESILPQHSLLCLLNVDSVTAASALRHAKLVCSSSKSSVTVVLTHAQHYRANTLSLTERMVKIGHIDRGVHLFRSASDKQRKNSSVAHVLHLAHPAVQQVNAVGRSLKMQFDGFAGLKENLQPARPLLDTGAESCFISEGFTKRCNLSVQSGQAQTVSLADGRQMTVQMTAEVCIRIGALLQKKLVCKVIPMSSSYDVILGEDWLTAGKALLEYTAEQGAAVRISKGQKTILLKQAAKTAAQVQSISYRCRQPLGLSSMLIGAKEIEHEASMGEAFLVRVFDKHLAGMPLSAV